jgi:hypothetical protein
VRDTFDIVPSLDNGWRVSSEPITSSPRGVEFAHVIDLIAEDSQTGEVTLIMLESRPWDGAELRLFQLQEKINAYLSFALDGEMAEAYPQFVGKKIRLQLDCVGMPDNDVVGFLSMVREQIAFQGINLEVRVMGEGGCGPGCGCH